MKSIFIMILSAIMLTSIPCSAFKVLPAVASETIYIRAGGSVEPSTAPILRNGEIYTLTTNISAYVVVERSGVIIDGAGCTLHGAGIGTGFYWNSIDHVTVKNAIIRGFSNGFELVASYGSTISDNRIIDSVYYGIYLRYSSGNRIEGNILTSSTVAPIHDGIYLHNSSCNVVSKNSIIHNPKSSNFYGISLGGNSIGNSFTRNNIENTTCAIALGTSARNTFVARAIGEDTFTFVNVTITVHGINGLPIRNLRVSAFNEEWGTVYPDRWFGKATDNLGHCILKIYKGNWTFFATGSSNDRGFYAIQNKLIDCDTSLLIQTDSTLNITAAGFDHSPLGRTDVYVVDNDHMPMIRLPKCGETNSDGSLVIEVTANSTYDLALSRGPPVGISSGEAFLIHLSNLHAGNQVDCLLKKEELAKVRFDIFNGTGIKGDSSHLNVQIPSISLQSEFVYFRDQNVQWENMTLWISPELVRFQVADGRSGWWFSFYEETCCLEQNQSYDQIYGGNFSASVLFNPPELHLDEQIMIFVKDQYGHKLAGFHDSNSTDKIPIKLTDKNTQDVIYDGYLYGFENNIAVQQDLANCSFEVLLGLGFFGSFKLSGMRSEHCVLLDNVATEHFVVHYPSLFGYRIFDFPDYAEQVYSLMETEIGHKPRTNNPDGKIHVYFTLWHPGWWDGSNVVMSSGWLFHPLHYPDPQLKGAFQHELAHSFQGGLDDDYYIEGETFGEPFASFLSTVVHADMYGRKTSLYYQSAHSDNFFKCLDGDRSIDMYWRMFFVLVYLKQRYSMEIQRDFVQLWGNSSLATRREKLFNARFNSNETIAVLYSFLAEENIAWLFQLVGFDISEQRVIEGLSLIETNIIDHIVPIDGKDFHVVTESNSIVSNLCLRNSQIEFDISGDSGSAGYCNVTIPKSLMNCTILDDWVIWINSTQLLPADFSVTENTSHTFIIFTFTFASSLHVTVKGAYVIPEFSLLLALSLFMVTVQILLIIYRRKNAKRKDSSPNLLNFTDKCVHLQ